jgi:formylglycine-generating enzyme required for sulfatase activity
VDVVGGNFFRTYTNTGQGPSGEADPASISGLRIDKYLVTVGRFRQFVRAWNEGSGYTPSAGAGKHAHLNSGQGLAAAGSPGMFEPGWVAIDDSWINPTDANLLGCPATTWTPAPGANENLPMNCIDWWEAYAFCIWDDAFLPSEAELGYVEAGGSDQREYPWGATAPGTNNEYAIFGYVRHGEVGCHYPETGRCTGAANIASVGAAKAGAGRWSQLDLTGDVGEWALDWFSAYDDPCTDCAQLDAVQTRVIRGAAYDSVEANLAPAFRDGRYPPGRNGDVGLRCARTP